MALWNTRVGSAFRILRVATTGKYDYVKTKTHVHFSIKPRLIAQTIRGYMAVAEPPDFISDPKSSSYIQVSRIMSHDDANPLGNIHGGILLRMIAEAGYISATKYFNSDRSRELPGYESCSAALARAERTSFLQPMFIGELAQLHAEVTYTSKHSLEVQVQVFAENILEGTRRLTNKASLWFVPVSIYARPKKILEVAEMNYKSPEIKEQGRQRYEFQLSERVLTHKSKRDVVGVIFNSNFGAQSGDPCTVTYSQTTAAHVVLSSDCTVHGHLKGGATMKIMDEISGMVAAKHCHSPVVTASVDAINFHQQVQEAGIIHMIGRPTYTGNKSMEVQVLVDVEYMDLSNGSSNRIYRERACDAFFTMVSLSADDWAPQSIPSLKLLTDAEKKRFEEGRLRQETRKTQRLQAKTNQ